MFGLEEELQDKINELQQVANKWKQIAEELHTALVYIRTYGSYPVADNAMNKFTEIWNTEQLKSAE